MHKLGVESTKRIQVVPAAITRKACRCLGGKIVKATQFAHEQAISSARGLSCYAQNETYFANRSYTTPDLMNLPKVHSAWSTLNESKFLN